MPVSRLLWTALGAAALGAAVTATCRTRTEVKEPADSEDEAAVAEPGEPTAASGGDFFAPAK